MRVEIKNELAFKCLQHVGQGVNVEDAVSILLERYMEKEASALAGLVNISKSSGEGKSVKEVQRNLRTSRNNKPYLYAKNYEYTENGE